MIWLSLNLEYPKLIQILGTKIQQICQTMPQDVENGGPPSGLPGVFICRAKEIRPQDHLVAELPPAGGHFMVLVKCLGRRCFAASTSDGSKCSNKMCSDVPNISKQICSKKMFQICLNQRKSPYVAFSELFWMVWGTLAGGMRLLSLVWLFTKIAIVIAMICHCCCECFFQHYL